MLKEVKIMTTMPFNPSLLDITKVDDLPGDFVDVSGVINSISITERETDIGLDGELAQDGHDRDNEIEITLDVSCRQVALDVELTVVGVLSRPPNAPSQAASCAIRAADGGVLNLHVFDRVVVRVRCDSDSLSPRRWALDLVATLIGRQTRHGTVRQVLSSNAP
eukprot:gnl/Chilomastix_caulleri/3531.p1 GENE.gnl/Chilomastix_caulleri/3531~~gnl/Chilomastix_caulleri/3531.p1  ORF type:complete len:164 (+),score=34.12 gnl/Chilomastix_caulleri/3531:8-499(+)